MIFLINNNSKMVEENPTWPWTPAKLHPIGHNEIENPIFKSMRNQRSSKCFLFVFAGIVLVSFIILIFALTMLRPKTPHVKIRSVTVTTLKYHTSSTLSSLNTTLTAVIPLKNRNFGEFNYENTTARFLYRGVKIAEVKIVKGHVKARSTKELNVNVTVRITSSFKSRDYINNLRRDINYGTLKLNGEAEFKGKVHVMNIIKTKKTRDQMNCTITLYLKTKTVKDLECK